MKMVQHGTEQISDIPLKVMRISEVRDLYREISKFWLLPSLVDSGCERLRT